MAGQLAVFVKSNKKGPFLVDTEEFEYRIKSNTPETATTYWICRKKDAYNCKARAKTQIIEEQEYLKEVTGNHNHSNNILKKRVKAIQAQEVENAARNPTIACRTVLGNLCNKLQNDSLAAATSMSRSSTLKMQIYRGRLVKVHIKLSYSKIFL